MLLSKKLAFLSINTALCILFLILASIIPTNTIFFTLFSTVFVMIGVYEYKIKGGLTIFISSAILGFFMLPSKNVWLLFTVFFGYYPLIKAIIERQKRLFTEWLSKISAGTVIFFILYFLFKNMFFSEIKLNIFILFIISAFIFIIYDLALYNTVLSEEAISHNWNYANKTWNIEK